MNLVRLTIFAGLLASTNFALSTTHILYYDGKAAHVGSDSKRILGPNAITTTCKVATGNGAMVTISGRTFKEVSARQPSGNVNFTLEMRPYAEEILGKNEPIEDKIKELKERSFTTLLAAWQADRRTGRSYDIESYNISLILIHFVEDVPLISHFFVAIKDWQKGPEPPQDEGKEQPMDKFYPYLEDGGDNDPAHKEFNRPVAPGKDRDNPVEFVKAFLNRESQTRFEDVGPPFSIYKMTPQSIILTTIPEGLAFCPPPGP